MPLAEIIHRLDPAKISDIDLTSETIRQNYVAVTSEWARQAPFYAVADGLPKVVCARFSDVTEVYNDRERFSTKIPAAPGLERFHMFNTVETLLETDGEEHDRIRRLMNPVFGGKAVAALEADITAIVNGLLDNIAKTGPDFDAMDDFSRHIMPATLLDVMFKVTSDQKRIFIEMSDAVPLATSTPPGGTFPEEYLTKFSRAQDMIYKIIVERRAAPGDDFISALIRAKDEQGALTDEQLFNQVFTLLAGALVTTSSCLGGMFIMLGKHPDQFQELLQDRILMATAIEECLRYHGAGYFSFLRFALEDTEVGGTFVPEGMPIICSQQAASFDSAQYPDPLRFNIHRNPKAVLVFGGGTHNCLGSRLARLVFRVGLGRMMDRFPGLRLSDPDFVPVYHGIQGETNPLHIPMSTH